MAFSRFDRYIERHANAFIERLQALCRMPSVAARGTGMRAVAEMVENLMQRVGAGTRVFKFQGGHSIVFGECGAGERCILVYGHYDVQPVGPLQEWATGPFAARVIDSKLYARGASNSKGDLIARLAAVEAYQKTFGKLPICLRFIVEGEDGIGSPSLYRLTAEQRTLLQADGCLWDEGYKNTRNQLVLSLGFKGIAFFELRADVARTDLHSKWGGIVPNPAWRLVQALATLVSSKGVITIDGFSQYIAPIQPEDLQALKTIQLDEAGLRQELHINKWVRDLSGRALTEELIFGSTCTICGIQTGHTEAGSKTVLPGTAVARIDFRLVPSLTPMLVKQLLREHLDRRGFQDLQIAELAAAPFAKSSVHSAVAQAAIESATEVYNTSPIIYPLDPASGPVGAVCGASNPPAPLVSFGVSHAGSNPHGPNENIHLDDFVRGIKYFGRVIHHIGKMEELQT